MSHRDSRNNHRSNLKRKSEHSRNSEQPRTRHRSHSRENRRRKHEKRERGQTSWRETRIKEEPASEPEQRHTNPNRRRNRNRNNDQNQNEQFEWGKPTVKEESKPEDDKPKAKPDFGLSGKLAEDTNTFNGFVIKYNEPMEARKPKRRWRLYPFKGETSLPFIPVHRQSAYLIGRERKICDMPVDHPSCSKQHAVFQYRLVDYERDDGTIGKRIRPYIIDLESANGTFVNNKQIEAKRYLELMERDVIKFGYSTREYVLLHENSKQEEEDDDVVLSS